MENTDAACSDPNCSYRAEIGRTYESYKHELQEPLLIVLRDVLNIIGEKECSCLNEQKYCDASHIEWAMARKEIIETLKEYDG